MEASDFRGGSTPPAHVEELVRLLEPKRRLDWCWAGSMRDGTRDPNGMALDGKEWSHVAAGLCGSDVLRAGAQFWVLRACGKAYQKEQEEGLGGRIQEQWSCGGEATWMQHQSSWVIPSPRTEREMVASLASFSRHLAQVWGNVSVGISLSKSDLLRLVCEALSLLLPHCCNKIPWPW